jgi:hypothetical protein
MAESLSSNGLPSPLRDNEISSIQNQDVTTSLVFSGTVQRKFLFVFSWGGGYCGNCLMLVTWSPLKRTKTVFDGGWP